MFLMNPIQFQSLVVDPSMVLQTLLTSYLNFNQLSLLKWIILLLVLYGSCSWSTVFQMRLSFLHCLMLCLSSPIIFGRGYFHQWVCHRCFHLGMSGGSLRFFHLLLGWFKVRRICGSLLLLYSLFHRSRNIKLITSTNYCQTPLQRFNMALLITNFIRQSDFPND